ncbi:putative glycoside hydrolase [Corynebacterium breve]|uniref:Glycoside hydrolase n=1 Tax=Corynebacterium breve TaxID=3049799 RepID=A0ABY8VGE4_9CORY|nr:putative glycoside hydrolase [Corynebacterium breve]WIM68177.1 putative glycoside hydrolase [Corynebacterium breve]
MPCLAWLRNGNPIEPEEVQQAAGKFRVAIVQPWETEAARYLSEHGTTVLAYQCLSSVRVYEPGPVFSSGLSAAQASALGTNTGMEWQGYPGHFQQEVWRDDYADAWVNNVVSLIDESPFDGVFADNDVFDDYYGTGIDIRLMRRGLDALITKAGQALNDRGKLLIPNIAEGRVKPGRWRSHARFGGGFEECLFAWGTEPGERLSLDDMLAQVDQLHGPGLVIARIPGTNVELALAAAWVFAPQADLAVTATWNDHADAMPWTPLGDVDLGDPLSPLFTTHEPGQYSREFTGGRAVVDLNTLTGSIEIYA